MWSSLSWLFVDARYYCFIGSNKKISSINTAILNHGYENQTCMGIQRSMELLKPTCNLSLPTTFAQPCHAKGSKSTNPNTSVEYNNQNEEQNHSMPTHPSTDKNISTKTYPWAKCFTRFFVT